MTILQVMNRSTKVASQWSERLNGVWHSRALSLYMLVVFGHWAEHIVQAYQVFVLNWERPAAGGILGLWFPTLVSSEVLHFAYNLALLLGLACLRPGFCRGARGWWTAAVVIQCWHFYEHFLLQLQWLTGTYLFGASQSVSVLQLWVPRLELHLLYNTLVFMPMIAGLFIHTRSVAPDVEQPG